MIRLRPTYSASVWAIAMVLVFSPSMSSAGQGVGTINGTIEDETGGVLPGVIVTAISAGTDGSGTAVSDGEGRYTISDLAAGSYEMVGLLPGFRGAAATVTVTAGGSAMVNMSLTIAPVTVVAPIQQTTTIWRVIFGWFLNRDYEDYSSWVLTGIGVSLLGALTLTLSTEFVIANLPLPDLLISIARWQWP